jgi:PPOX class probable F420-dependent enzyme
MTDEERLAFLDEEKTVIVASFGPRGWPHQMPLWFMPRDGEVWVSTYGKSQKIRNLERDPRASLLVEGGDSYEELRGVLVEAEAEIHTDFETSLALVEDLQARHSDGLDTSPARKAEREQQARKRVAVQFKPLHTVSWDHRKS